MVPQKLVKTDSIGSGLASMSRGGIISRSTHLIPLPKCPLAWSIQRILNIKKRSGGKSMNHTEKTIENMVPIMENMSLKLEKRILMANGVR